jgi:hypothetical protein
VFAARCVIYRNGSAVTPMLGRVRSDMIETCAPGPFRLVLQNRHSPRMTDRGQMKLITREHILDSLARADLTPEQEQEQGQILPSRTQSSSIGSREVYARYGVTKDSLISRPGGRPLGALISGRHARSGTGSANAVD